jgi:uncharacterized protein
VLYRGKMMKRKDLIAVGILSVGVIAIFFICYYFFQDPFYFLKPQMSIERIEINSDKDKDGILDQDDIILGARKEIENKTKYKSAYYEGGYPPDNEGVCTDVIWRALKAAGYGLKYLMDEDIRDNWSKYWKVIDKADPNIDFRRVKNQYIFFKDHAQSLTIKVKPHDKQNLGEWQGGDIVVLKNPDHVAVISDIRRRDGVPYVIHNSSTIPKENDRLMKWYKNKRIIGHFRYPNSN